MHGLSFFFQAEDGIRDGRVTGVQTCALPISLVALGRVRLPRPIPMGAIALVCAAVALVGPFLRNDLGTMQIGRASCRERVEIYVDGGALKRNQDAIIQVYSIVI